MKKLPIFLLFLFIASSFVFARGQDQAQVGAPRPAVGSGQTGYASWYGGKFHGRQTANGEIFDTYKFTAAHKTLPFDSIVRVKNLENNKTTVVRINDRGPFIEGRIIDLSYAAARDIDMVEKGIVKVAIEIIEGDASRAVNYVYRIQIGAYRDIKNAQNMVSRLSANGFNPSIEQAENGIFRVVLANIERDDIEECRAMLRRAGFTNYLVKREIRF
ncbi:MAG: septal ring lytic transglycosylase RlpA family protein [Spirochaetes bacterium]|nr:septal ring lytic transglycosylase RlpA family protein [Spirochaetota bacterium]